MGVIGSRAAESTACWNSRDTLFPTPATGTRIHSHVCDAHTHTHTCAHTLGKPCGSQTSPSGAPRCQLSALPQRPCPTRLGTPRRPPSPSGAVPGACHSHRSCGSRKCLVILSAGHSVGTNRLPWECEGGEKECYHAVDLIQEGFPQTRN